MTDERSSDESPTLLNRLDPAAVLGCLLAPILGVLAIRPVTSPDFWWHVSMGRAVWDAVALSFADPVAAGAREYQNIVWLFDVPLYLLFDWGGVVAVNTLVAFLAMGCFLVCWRLALDICGPEAQYTALAVATLAAGGAHLRFIQRPQAAFLFLLPLTLWLAHRAAQAEGRRRWPWLVALFLTTLSWAQIHASVVIAPAVAAAAALPWAFGPGVAWPRSLSETLRKPFEGLEGTLAVIAATAVAPVAGPSGFDLLRRVLAHQDNYSVRKIAEMKPMTLEMWLQPTRDILLAEILAVLVVAAIFYRRRLDVGPLLLAGLGLYLTLGTNRFAAAWALLMLPLAATVLKPSYPDGWRRQLAALVTVIAVPALLSLGSRAPSFEVDDKFPEGPAEALAQLQPGGTVFNTYDDGGYLGWQLYGDARVFFDSRAQMHFDVEEFYAGVRALPEPQVFLRLDQGYDFTAAVIPRDAPLCRALNADPAWSAAWTGEDDTVFLPTVFLATQAVAKPLRSLSACGVAAHEQACRQAPDPSVFLAEVDQLMALAPGDGHAGRLGALLALRCFDQPRFEEATRYLGAAAGADPDHPELRWAGGLLLIAQGNMEGALEVFADLPPDHHRGHALRINLLRQKGDVAAVLEAAQEQVRLLDDLSPPFLREQLAWACEETGDRDCAVREAARAALAGDAKARQRLIRYREQGWIRETLRPLADAVLTGQGPSSL